MFLFENFDKEIAGQLRREEAVKAAEHKSSGKLSASMLGEPLQWQVLKTLGIGVKQVDDYTLRKFEVGRDTEDWFMRRNGALIVERQVFVEYAGAIGYADALVDAEIALDGALRHHRIPLEVKSASNAKFKRILTRAAADEHHKLQAAFYALGLNSPYYGITYVATDDRRTHTWIFATEDMRPQIDRIIDTYRWQMESRLVPKFEPKFEWQKKVEYNKYPEWSGLSEKEIKLAMDSFYPDAWENYLNAKKN